MSFNFYIVAIEFIEAIDTIEARFALSLRLRVEDTLVRKISNKFAFSLTYSYSDTACRRYSRSENCK